MEQQIKDQIENEISNKDYSKFNAAKLKGKAKEMIELLEDSEIEYIELDQTTEILSEYIPSNINKTNAPEVWNFTKGNNIKIAFLDSGVSSHDDLSMAGGISIISNDYTDYNGHGTAVAGVLSAVINNNGLIGVAPEADIYAVKITEGLNGNLSDAIEGVEWAINNNMDIITMSFGIQSYSMIFI